ncbi:TetR family transcriptional regulator [Paenibacillus harenae]|uniref:TetR/AcrR family transcriptional regulator n=1 Tax=Paenibacillus harenae TaxID=306543 RepID=UPI0004926C3E|nr:TetR family transcriptional regulator [Paenibacillus harenae]
MSDQKHSSRKNTRDSEATRQQILLAARALFSQDSYERVTVRKIAARAGIDAALVIRYFGSKEELFLSALTSVGICPSNVFEGEITTLGERMLNSQVPEWDKHDPNDPMLIIMRTLANPDASSSLRKLLDQDIVQPMAMLITASSPQLRAEFVLSQLIGLAVVRNLLRSEALSAIPLEQLTEMLNPVFQYYLEGKVPTSESAADLVQ